MTRTADNTQTFHDYSNAVDHYLSSSRRDSVKVQAEEPFTRHILNDAFEHLQPRLGSTVRVLDIGCGTGDGLALLTASQDDGRLELSSLYNIDYHGIDTDPSMVHAARQVNAGAPCADFSVGDMRACAHADTDTYDLYLSFGVPWSHLAPQESQELLADLFAKTRGANTRTTIIVDVLGRYSVEWVKHWSHAQWYYSMSFMDSVDQAERTQMSFHSQESLHELIAGAAEASGTSPSRVRFYDRSILMGRHTATAAFNPAVSPYRTLVNELLSGRCDIDLHQLHFTPPIADCPPQIQEFFAVFASIWNERVYRAINSTHDSDPANLAARNVSLGKQLIALERRHQRGLGVGHSLTAAISLG